MEELEAIVERLEHDDLDVDRLASDVARAAELVAICRTRIEAARLQVQQVVDDLG
jgi:exodeoxyribonuclease VII small subunit